MSLLQSHQICTFHIVAEVTKAVLGAVASARKGLAATQRPTLRRGRPSTPAAKQAARTKKRLETQRAALLSSRYLFVQRHLQTERKTLWRVSRGLPQLQTLRAIMEQVYALFDRRCRTQTALDKLAKLQRHVQRFPPSVTR